MNVWHVHFLSTHRSFRRFSPTMSYISYRKEPKIPFHFFHITAIPGTLSFISAYSPVEDHHWVLFQPGLGAFATQMVEEKQENVFFSQQCSSTHFLPGKQPNTSPPCGTHRTLRGPVRRCRSSTRTSSRARGVRCGSPRRCPVFFTFLFFFW